MKRRGDGVEFIQFDAKDVGALKIAEKRITPLIRAWASYPAISGMDLYWLAVCCYLQGTVDGYGCAEAAMEAKNES